MNTKFLRFTPLILAFLYNMIGYGIAERSIEKDLTQKDNFPSEENKDPQDKRPIEPTKPPYAYNSPPQSDESIEEPSRSDSTSSSTTSADTSQEISNKRENKDSSESLFSKKSTSEIENESKYFEGIIQNKNRERRNIDPLKTSLGKTVKSCLQKTISQFLPPAAQHTQEAIEYSEAYSALLVFETSFIHLSGSSTLPSEKTIEEQRTKALQTFSPQDPDYNPTYRSLIRDYNLKKALLEKKLGTSIKSNGGITQKACQKLIFQLIQENLKLMTPQSSLYF